MPWILPPVPSTPPSVGLADATTAGGATRPHLAWPIRFDPGGGFVNVEQDSDDDVASCIGTIVSWPLGQHPSDPNFGAAEQAFLQGGGDLAEIQQAIVQSEPRAADLAVVQDPVALTDFLASIDVSFTVRDGET